QVVFWRPTTRATVALNTGSDSESWDVALAFSGARPRIVFRGMSAGTYGLWAIAATDAGRTWAAPVHIPPDGLNEATGPISVAVSPSAHAAVTGETESLAADDGRCGWPKVARSEDFHHWETCSPIAGASIGDGEAAVACDGDHLLVAGTNRDRDERPPGIYVWRESPATAARTRAPTGRPFAER